MPAESFSVTSEQLRTFAGALDTRATEIRASGDVVQGIPTGVSTYGIIGQVFAAAVRSKLSQARDSLNEGATGIEEAATQVRDAATTYDDTDTVNSETFGGGAV